jgi:HTH-type transcriptional regulator / antitoxin HigA
LKTSKKIKMKRFPITKYPITPITNEEIYLKYCDWAEEISDMEFDDPNEQDSQFAHLDTFVTLIQAYEAKNFEFNKIKLTLPEIIEQAMEQLNIDKKALARLLGSNRVSEIFSGKRQLSLNQIRILHRELRIPAHILVGV